MVKLIKLRAFTSPPGPLSVITEGGSQTTQHPPKIDTESSHAPLSVRMERGWE